MSKRLGKISSVRYSRKVGRPKLGKKDYTSTMSPDVLKALDAYAKRVGRTRGEVIEELVRRQLGFPVIEVIDSAAPKKHSKDAQR